MADVLERGDIFFLYRPRVEHVEAHSLEDVQRLYVILHPRGRDDYRRLVIGRKRMPQIGARERHWAFVDRVARTPEPIVDDLREVHYATATRGERELSPARPAGEGMYAIVAHDDHSHLAYRLELPAYVGEVQRDFRIELEASYVAAVRNPETPSPPGVGLPARDRPAYPDDLRAQFHGRRFAPLVPGFLDHVGTELVLIGSSGDIERELGIELDPARETLRTAELFTDLALDRREHPITPLIAGEWI